MEFWDYQKKLLLIRNRKLNQDLPQKGSIWTQMI